MLSLLFPFYTYFIHAQRIFRRLQFSLGKRDGLVSTGIYGWNEETKEHSKARWIGDTGCVCMCDLAWEGLLCLRHEVMHGSIHRYFFLSPSLSLPLSLCVCVYVFIFLLHRACSWLALGRWIWCLVNCVAYSLSLVLKISPHSS